MSPAIAVTRRRAEFASLVRAALRDDARAKVRVHAIVALSASAKAAANDAYTAALDDPDPAVQAEAAFTLTVFARASVGAAPDAQVAAVLRAHAPALRAQLASPDARTRANLASVLVFLVDPDVDLGVLLRDPTSLVRGEGMKLAIARAAAARTIPPADVTLLDAVARSDPDGQLRLAAVNAVAGFAPAAAAAPVLAAAFERGDVDTATARAITEARLTVVVPAMLAYVQKEPRATYFIEALAALHATCASAAIGALLTHFTAGDAAAAALRSLSGHPEWTPAQLGDWARQQPAHVAPCQ